MCALVCQWCDVVLLSMLRYICIASAGVGVTILPVSVGLVASCWPAAMVGNVPTVFLSVGMSG